MILVDKSIKERSGEIFCEGYAEKYVNAISYDLHIKGVICDDALKDSYTLHPGEFILFRQGNDTYAERSYRKDWRKEFPYKTGVVCWQVRIIIQVINIYLLRIQNITCANITIREMTVLRR